jgi:hypothetical protein
MKNSTLSRILSWLTVLVILSVFGFVMPAKTWAQNDDTPYLTVIAPVASVREGPGFTHEVITYLLQGDQVSAIGYDADADWWEVELPNGESGWINGRPYFVSITGDTSELVEPLPITSEISTNNSQFTQQSKIADSFQSGTIVFQTTSGGEIYAINADGTNLRYLTSGMDPAISPDGQWVAFTRWESDGPGSLGSVWVINIGGTGARNQIVASNLPAEVAAEIDLKIDDGVQNTGDIVGSAAYTAGTTIAAFGWSLN